MPEWRKHPELGFTMTELAIALGILAVLSGVVLLNLGTFVSTGNTQGMDAERYLVTSAVSKCRIDGNMAAQPFSVGPDDKGVLGSYLSGNLKYYWNISIDGGVSRGTATLFSSDLNSLAGFTTLMGSWAASGGVLSAVGDQNSLVVSGGPWDDFVFQTTATLISGNGYGMYYRCDSNPNITGYIFQYDPGPGNIFIVRKVVGGNEFSPFQVSDMSAGFPLNGQHDISVSVQGDHHVIKVDNKTVLDFHDNQYGSGTVGLRSWSNSKVNITKFIITPQ
jgi:hypothetical protein